MCVFLCAGLSSAQAQSSVFSTSVAGNGSVLLNTTSFKYPALTPLYSYPVGFPLITCNASSGNPTQTLNVSLGSSLVPATRADATSPYPAVHATIRVAWPNNVTGKSWHLTPFCSPFHAGSASHTVTHSFCVGAHPLIKTQLVHNRGLCYMKQLRLPVMSHSQQTSHHCKSYVNVNCQC